jgi:RNA polymerase sigma-70 factor, ECF subfamily
MLNNRADAEDVTSDVFLQVLNRKYIYTRLAKFSTWLFTVTRNACISRLRKRKLFVSLWIQKNDSDDYEVWDLPDTNESASDELKQKETRALVRRAINQLPLMQKDALIMREYMRLSYDEIAQVLGCSLENVKISIFRGRERLRIELASLIQGEAL